MLEHVTIEFELVKRLRESSNFHPLHEHALREILAANKKRKSIEQTNLGEKIAKHALFRDYKQKVAESFNRTYQIAEKKLAPGQKNVGVEITKVLFKSPVLKDMTEEINACRKIVEELKNAGLVETFEGKHTIKLGGEKIPCDAVFVKIKQGLKPEKVLKALKSHEN